MSKWVIDKEFGGDYGHRVWSQKLNSEFATKGQQLVCRHMHGHRFRAHIFLESDHLDRGMVTDFHHLNWLKNFLDDHIDHKFILDVNDPWFNNIVNGQFSKERDKFLVRTPEPYVPGPKWLNINPVYVPETTWFCGHTFDTSDLNEGPEKEFYEGFFLVDFVPTSEHLCKWLFDLVQAKMERINVTVSRVDWWETPKSRSSYSR